MSEERLAQALGGIYGGYKCEIENVLNAFKELQNLNSKLNDQLDRELIKRARLEDKLKKITKIVESYNLGKYDFSIPTIGIIEILDVLEGKK